MELAKIESSKLSIENKEKEITDLVESAKGLKIDGIEDKEGFKVCETKRKELKAKRSELIKIVDEGKAPILKVGKWFDEKRNWVKDTILPEENRLDSEAKNYKKQIQEEKERKANELRQRTTQRAVTLTDLGFYYNGFKYSISFNDHSVKTDSDELLTLSDEEFNSLIEESEPIKQAIAAAKVEEERLSLIEAEKEKKRIEEEEAEKKRLAEIEAKKQAEEKAELAKERAIIEAEKKVLADQKADVEKEKVAIAKANQERLDKIAEEKKVEADKLAKVQADKQAEIATEKAEKEAKEKAKADKVRQAELAPVKKDLLANILSHSPNVSGYENKEADQIYIDFSNDLVDLIAEYTVKVNEL